MYTSKIKDNTNIIICGLPAFSATTSWRCLVYQGFATAASLFNLGHNPPSPHYDQDVIQMQNIWLTTEIGVKNRDAAERIVG
ncbi:unnamed protein product [Brassica rapa]|uniref:Uncharacterized protein n=2 Tax=Brassica TaxID=3705 RepID=A0A8D9GST7_BRACM|nr:unnamed protein product [Brassica napus]CAG7885756.1 unnamed protein product [Brassica rapa]